jgi:Raf kinase inhibitor-like YbhB/YbcL family protein
VKAFSQARKNAPLISPVVIFLLLYSTIPARSFARNPAAPYGGDAMAFAISSTSFSNGGDIAKKFTCDGDDVSPQLAWTNPPAGTKSLALLADDPDAPVGNWNHWVLWNIPGETRQLAENVAKSSQLPDGSRQGVNDFHKTGYNGPCPPPGKPHRYYFKLFALDTKLDLKGNVGRRELEAAIKGHTLGQTEWMGRFGR